MYVLYRSTGSILISFTNSDFLSVAVSGMDSGSLLCGHPYGGCSVLYRKSLSSCIIPLASSSNRFCGIKVIDSNGSS